MLARILKTTHADSSTSLHQELAADFCGVPIVFSSSLFPIQQYSGHCLLRAESLPPLFLDHEHNRVIRLSDAWLITRSFFSYSFL